MGPLSKGVKWLLSAQDCLSMNPYFDKRGKFFVIILMPFVKTRVQFRPEKFYTQKDFTIFYFMLLAERIAKCIS